MKCGVYNCERKISISLPTIGEIARCTASIDSHRVLIVRNCTVASQIRRLKLKCCDLFIPQRYYARNEHTRDPITVNYERASARTIEYD